RIDPLDEAYVLGLFERPDVTVVIKGLANGLDPHLWNTRYLNERCGEMMYHSFRRFTRPGGARRGPFVPIPIREEAWSSMRLRDFVRYLNKRADAKRARAIATAAAAPTVEAPSAAAAPGQPNASVRGRNSGSVAGGVENGGSNGGRSGGRGRAGGKAGSPEEGQ
ncbi:unnamed protein product, partial [Ectocarpus sp. 13 AM-2016]